MLIGANKSDESPQIYCGNEIIKFISEIKLLGIIIDNKLSFSSQVSNLCNKVNKKTYILNKNIKIFSINFRPILYKLFIQSLFDYCSTVFLHLSKTDNKRIQNCFFRSIRRIMKIKISHLENNLQLQYKELKNKFLKSDDNHNCCTRNTYTRPVFNKTKNIYKFAFSTISIQTLNFLDNKFSEHNSSLIKRIKKQIDIKTYLLENIETFYDKFSSFIT